MPLTAAVGEMRHTWRFDQGPDHAVNITVLLARQWHVKACTSFVALRADMVYCGAHVAHSGPLAARVVCHKELSHTCCQHARVSLVPVAVCINAARSLYECNTVIIVINPCKPYHFGIGTAPHPLGRWRVD
jgi:hypothetical protein